MLNPAPLTINGRSYAIPQRPAIVICLDGCEPAYLDAASDRGLCPALERIRRHGTERLAHSAMPSFTNPNNLSIATGRPPSVHGICGNFFFDALSGEEVMMNEPRFLRAPTIFCRFHDAGYRVAIVTAKDKLRTLLGHGIDFSTGRAVCFSAERLAHTSNASHGIDNASRWLEREVPDVYSAALSECVFAAGVKLVSEYVPDILYLTTTDYIQHKFAPGEATANRFYAMFDRYLDKLDASGAVVVVTADHGMKRKHEANGSPNVLYLQDTFDRWYGEQAVRVILPITDPYVVHHGALGSFATAYVSDSIDAATAMQRLAGIEGIAEVLDRETAAARFELPADRIGDIVILSDEHGTLGASEHRHDLSALDAPLRSHGGLSEQEVPFIVNRKVPELKSAPVLRNFDAYAVACQVAARS